MKKTLVIALAAGAAVLVYFVIRKKYNKQNNRAEFTPRPAYEKHHLTNAFANAKKHAMQASEPAQN